jgi:hypothetical protein
MKNQDIKTLFLAHLKQDFSSGIDNAKKTTVKIDKNGFIASFHSGCKKIETEKGLTTRVCEIYTFEIVEEYEELEDGSEKITETVEFEFYHDACGCDDDWKEMSKTEYFNYHT